MSKMKIKLKITGFELEVEGSSNEVPKIMKDVQDQMSSLIAPPSIMDNKVDDKIIDTSFEDVSPKDGKKGKPKSKSNKNSKKSNTTSNTKNDVSNLLWVNDPDKWGTPQQKWNPTNKILWVLYVVEQEKNISQLALSNIVNVFNTSFKEAGTILHPNASRDIKKAKTKKLVGENTTKTPSEWYLTQDGKKEAERLIAEARKNK